MASTFNVPSTQPSFASIQATKSRRVMISACFQRDWNGFGYCFGLCLIRAVAQVSWHDPMSCHESHQFPLAFVAWERHEQDFVEKKEWCIFTADIYTAFTTKSALNSCSACHVGPKSMALPQDSCIWGESPVWNMGRYWVLGSCNTARPQQLSFCTKGTRAFPKTPNKSPKWGLGAWGEEGIDSLSWSAMCCDTLWL